MHVATERVQQQHTGRKDGEHERLGSLGGRRRADVLIKLIPPVHSVTEATKSWNAGKFVRTTKKGGNRRTSAFQSAAEIKYVCFSQAWEALLYEC